MTSTIRATLPQTGVDTLSNETALQKGAVRSAINVDIGRAGTYGRRDGFARVDATPGLHSLYSAVQKAITLICRSDNLCQLDTDNYTITQLFPLRSAYPAWYCEYNGNLYFTNRTTLGWIPSNSTSARAVGVPVPSTPTLDVGTGGLTKGKYAVAISTVDDRGEESGACEVGFVTLEADGGIKLSNLPQLAGHTVFVYITSADGDVLRKAAEFPAVFAEYTVGDNAQGGDISTQFLVPLPPGDFVGWHNGRLYTAGDGAVRFSEAGRPHLHDPAHGIIPFSGEITLFEPVVDGIYVGDSRGVWFLSGMDPEKFQLQRVSSCRAVARSGIMVPPEHFPEKQITSEFPVALWLSTSGYVVGMPGGVAVELQPDRVKVASGLSGRSVFLLRDGRKQVITPVNSTSTAAFGTAVDSVIP